jgi:adenine-specific DNA-methyltransferase
MQAIVLQRYLGNKGKLIDDIIEVIGSLAKPGDTVFDAFSGTLSVSMALKRQNYRVISNDINLFSWVYGTAYLTNSSFPLVNLKSLGVAKSPGSPWASLVNHLTKPFEKEFPRSARRNDFFNHYCEAGKNSSFESSRGTKGRRRFFNSDNAVLIDRALSRIRFWSQQRLLDDVSISILTTILLSAIERVSNTQGTYHDFPRDSYDSRSLQPLALRLPQLDAFEGRTDHILGKKQDTLEFVHSLPEHKVIYIDPPYNFRQYTSYYFLPNLVAAYPFVDDLDAYFDKVQYVRGQNMEDDFKSSFCSTQQFMPSLEKLISSAKCKHIVMSYFDGKNHWSGFKSKDDLEGFNTLSSFFKGRLFKKGSFDCIPVDRLNYQSYGGYKAETVREYLFVAEKC